MISADYIVGLTDGEGCFYVNVRDRKPGKWNPKIETHFYIKLREEDKRLLEDVKRFFKRGAVYFQKEKRKNHSSCYRFEINSQKDIQEILIPFFKKHTLHSSSKRKSFTIFCRIAKIIHTKNGDGKLSLRKIQQLKTEMNNHGARPVRKIRSPGGESK